MTININYNPDVLNCLTNISNDEVFTPPHIANKMLDLLPQNLFTDKTTTFLDPVCKSGVFLREITKRLIVGLETEIPDLQTRINHIFQNQIFGIAMTELTALMARRTVYCTKNANGDKSITDIFTSPSGNIIFEPTPHIFKGEKCVFCGASQTIYDRDESLETHAYPFIHKHNPQDIFKMKFDVIIGNPPYQLNVGVEKENYAIALYHKFVQQAKKLNPRFLTMIIPARWYAGGRGLDDFREEMLNDKRITKIIDYPNSTDCFPSVDISGGICYFLWEKDSNSNDCEITTIKGKNIESVMQRPLLENKSNTFIRQNEAIEIIRKIRNKKEKTFDTLVSPQTPFGIISSFKEYEENYFENSVKLHTADGIKYIRKDQIIRNNIWSKDYKVYISAAYGERGNYPYLFLGKPFIGEPNSVCTQTYLCIGTFESQKMCENVVSYIKTRFFRFCVMLKKNTQHAMRDKYSFVPLQDFNESWTDEKLYKKYGLTQDEIAFIDSMIRPME